MKLYFDAEELCAVCMLTWPGPFPLFKGVQGILPDGVKNVVKWKSNLGLKKLLKKEKSKLEQANLLETGELIDIMITIMFYEKSISILCEKDYVMSFFEAPEGYVVLKFLNDGNNYEISNYVTQYEMYDDIKKVGTDIWREANGEITLKFCQRDERGKVECKVINNARALNQEFEELLTNYL